MIRGGHRFWTAPEADHSYDLDNAARRIGSNSGDNGVEAHAGPRARNSAYQKVP